MSILAERHIAAFLAARMQKAMPAMAAKQSGGVDPRDRLPEFVAERSELVIPVTPAAPAVVYRAAAGSGPRPVHVNFHGGGYIIGQLHGDDALCRCIAQEAGVDVVDVDYAVAPQHPFPVPAAQAYDIVRWVVANASAHGWDASRLTIGGQSAGGALAAAAARQALDAGRPDIRLQVLHYPPLDLTIPAARKHSPRDKPMLRPWMGEVFDSAYVPDRTRRADPLVSPAAVGETADIAGIAPAVMITGTDDILHDEDVRYAERLRAGGRLVELIEVPGADHAYDGDDALAREIYPRIAAHIRAA
ncbi:alpha/beta hydrolase fold domain-containing protein [Microbacterium sp. SORGH_AS_0888]|uniref:alpha/beta hydrolase fold domain-containing protein n=1 Tax=Microbacterium sp. SORGH_AS_0888 TaxID=3041791 RepID=UPI00278A585B|nr:alpha/beta hydrolase fold domain-containing protein [Microbacterium sp. SORGH_AS_0888]MDQ1129629.1 acetyl esterase [Microbacterium sp. SORGH_AS_0888]